MAPLEPEWLLWAKRLQNEHKSLLLRIDVLTQVTAQVGPLVERTKDLSARTDQFQAENKLAIEKLSALGRSASKQENETSVEMKRLRGRIEDLEKELSRTNGSLEERRARNESLDEPKKYGITASLPVAATKANLRPRAGEVIVSLMNSIPTTNSSNSFPSDFASYNYR